MLATQVPRVLGGCGYMAFDGGKAEIAILDEGESGRERRGYAKPRRRIQRTTDQIASH